MRKPSLFVRCGMGAIDPDPDGRRTHWRTLNPVGAVIQLTGVPRLEPISAAMASNAAPWVLQAQNVATRPTNQNPASVPMP